MTQLSTFMVNVLASDPDTQASILMTKYQNFALYDEQFNDQNLNKDVTERFVWTQNGSNPQTFTLSATLHPVNLPGGVYKIPFLANDGMCDGLPSLLYIEVDDPSKNDRPYTKEIPLVSVKENDTSIINLDEYGFDPDRNTSSIGMITYSITSTTPSFSRIKLCGLNPLTNNSNYILTVAPVTGDAGTTLIMVTIRATDSGSPSLTFDRIFDLSILPKSGTPITTNPSNLQNCFEETILRPDGLDPSLDLDSTPLSQIGSIPSIFNPNILNIPNINKAFIGNVEELELTLDRTLGIDKFIKNTISGGKLFIEVKLSSASDLKEEDLSSLNFVIISKENNKARNISGKNILFDTSSKHLLLEVQLPDDIPLGEATLLITTKRDGKLKAVSKINFSITPALKATSIVTGTQIGKPIIKDVRLVKIPGVKNVPANKKRYKLIITGENFIKRTVKINNKLITSPIAFQPFTLITFVNKEGISIERMRVTRSDRDAKRTNFQVILEYDDSLLKGKEDVRFFTVSTLTGQTTGKADFKAPQKPEGFKEEEKW
ncbi:MAG: hypothetical protein HYY52_05905 [Candidatus Melainabacteria bacterium]|nr:hypothetical protein [Candidatus Melainabacteria bacterium]